MPAYSRDRLASWATAATRARSLGKAAASTPLYAPEKQEWADGYDGCCGVGNTVTIPVFACGGRMNQYWYFASKHPMSASKAAALIRNMIRAASVSVRWCETISSRAIPMKAVWDRGDWFLFQ